MQGLVFRSSTECNRLCVIEAESTCLSVASRQASADAAPAPANQAPRCQTICFKFSLVAVRVWEVRVGPAGMARHQRVYMSKQDNRDVWHTRRRHMPVDENGSQET